jgi:hypothetical protein
MNRNKKILASVLGLPALAMVLLMGSGGTAFATAPADPTGGAGDTFFTGIQDYLTGHLIVLVLGLAVIGVIIGLVIKWGKKAAKSA